MALGYSAQMMHLLLVEQPWHFMQGSCVSIRDFLVLQASHIGVDLDVLDDMVGPILMSSPYGGDYCQYLLHTTPSWRGIGQREAALLAT